MSDRMFRGFLTAAFILLAAGLVTGWLWLCLTPLALTLAGMVIDDKAAAYRYRRTRRHHLLTIQTTLIQAHQEQAGRALLTTHGSLARQDQEWAHLATTTGIQADTGGDWAEWETEFQRQDGDR